MENFRQLSVEDFKLVSRGVYNSRNCRNTDIKFVKTCLSCQKAYRNPTWHNSFDVPCKDAVNDSVNHHHTHSITQTKPITSHRTGKQVGPLSTNPLLFIPGQITARETKRGRGQQTLKEQSIKLQLLPVF